MIPKFTTTKGFIILIQTKQADTKKEVKNSTLNLFMMY